VLAFSAVSVLFLYLLLRVQDKLWLALGVPKMPNHVAWNTALLPISVLFALIFMIGGRRPPVVAWP
jgi:K+-transporting ATPase A subunit